MGTAKNYRNHVPLARAFLGWVSKVVPLARAHLGWFPKPVPLARALFAPKWACPRALGPCPFSPEAQSS